MAKPRILMICDHAEPIGGSARVMFASREELLRRGYEVVVFGGMGDASKNDRPDAPVFSLNLQPYQSLGGLKSLKAGIWNPRIEYLLSKVIDGFGAPPFFAHVHSYREALTGALFQVLRTHRVPIVFSAHEYSLGCPYGGFLDFRKNAVCTRRGFSRQCITAQCQIGSYVRKVGILAKHAATRYRAHVPECIDRVIFVSETSRKVLLPYLAPGQKEALIPNPIDVPHQPRAEPEGQAGYLYVGALNAGKDPLTFAEAAREADVPATFIGEGSLAEEIHRVNPTAALLGQVAATEVIAAMRGSRALVFPSRFLETQGMAAYEAISQGVPVICAETTAAAALIEETGGGVLFRTGEVADLAQKLREMGSNERVRQASERGYTAFWTDPPTLERHVDQLETLYASLASEFQG